MAIREACSIGIPEAYSVGEGPSGVSSRLLRTMSALSRLSQCAERAIQSPNNQYMNLFVAALSLHRTGRLANFPLEMMFTRTLLRWLEQGRRGIVFQRDKLVSVDGVDGRQKILYHA